jgi:hypothetical protein
VHLTSARAHYACSVASMEASCVRCHFSGLRLARQRQTVAFLALSAWLWHLLRGIGRMRCFGTLIHSLVAQGGTYIHIKCAVVLWLRVGLKSSLDSVFCPFSNLLCSSHLTMTLSDSHLLELDETHCPSCPVMSQHATFQLLLTSLRPIPNSTVYPNANQRLQKIQRSC